MNDAKIAVLLIEEDPQVAQLVLLLTAEFALVRVDGADGALRGLAEEPGIEVVLLGSGGAGRGALRRLGGGVPVVALDDHRVEGALDARALERALTLAVARRPPVPRREPRRRYAHA
jgi:hypothetical protein